MKRLSITFTAVLLAILFAVQVSVQVVGAASSTEYISEVKVFMAKEEKDAKSALQNEGYNLLDCNLNQDAEGGLGSKGKKATYLGYKTTSNPKEAFTDLAVMNMKGGYSTEDYDSLMDQYLNSEILPMVESFMAAINEYRENYNSDNSANQTRASFIHDMLDKFTDDDTGKSMGSLLLNETKYEMGDDAYDALSDEEKKDHADIVTIFAQSYGKITMMIMNMITRASDTNDNTWIDRFSVTTYDDLVDDTGETPTDAKSTLSKQYDDDANTVVDMWDEFRDDLIDYDNIVEKVENYDSASFETALEEFQNMDENLSTEEQAEILSAYLTALTELYEYISYLKTIEIHDMFADIDYEDGTLLDFFTQDVNDDDFDITCIYPMIASLTDGQRAGLDYVSLQELTAMALTDEDGYQEYTLEDMPEISIYDGVDREIYDKGGVGVTSDAQRTDAVKKMQEESKSSKLSAGTIALWCVTAVSFAAMIGSASASVYLSSSSVLTNTVEGVLANATSATTTNVTSLATAGNTNLADMVGFGDDSIELCADEFDDLTNALSKTSSSSSICTAISVGCAVVAIVMAAVSIWQTYKDLKNYYNVEFTPQPRFLIEETDLVGYNKKGEKIVLKNQSAYYKIVETNRDESAEYYSTLGTGNDINGDVGQQWLTLYAVRYEGGDPILASSLKTVTKSSEAPSGYSTGIHFFGEDNAFNLNNTNYVWDEDAPSVYIYYKTDDSVSEGSTVSESGSVFSMGQLALVGGICLIAGAALTAICITFVRKRKEKKSS